MALSENEIAIAKACIQERPALAQAMRDLRQRGAEKSHVNRVLKRRSRNSPGVQAALLCMLDYIWAEEE